METSTAIQTTGLSKNYNASSILALEDLNIKVVRGEIFGFLGPNGAGKTTTIRLLLDLIKPTSGYAKIFGLDCNVSSMQVRQKIGYLPGELRLYTNTTGRNLFKLFTSFRPEQVSREYVDYLCQHLDIDIDTPVGRLSHGNRQKIGLALALMSKPDLLVLDEPTTGIDPLVQHHVLDLLKEAKSEGRTVFFSSHVLSDVDQICDRVGIIKQGKLVAIDEIQTLRKKKIHRIRITSKEPISPNVFTSLPKVRLLDHKNKTLHIEVTGEVDAVIKAASNHHLISLESEQPSLDEVFMAYYQNSPPKSQQTEKENV